MESVDKKAANAAYMKEYYKKNREKFLAREKARSSDPHTRTIRKAWRKSTRATLYAYVNNIKISSGCIDCRYNLDSRALEFDHVRGIKQFNISDMIRDRMSISKIQAEIDKCDVRCANCHKIKTFKSWSP